MKVQFLLPEEHEKIKIKFNKITNFDIILISHAINKVITHYCPKTLSRPIINFNIIQKAFLNIPYLEIESINLIDTLHNHICCYSSCVQFLKH